MRWIPVMCFTTSHMGCWYITFRLPEVILSVSTAHKAAVWADLLRSSWQLATLQYMFTCAALLFTFMLHVLRVHWARVFLTRKLRIWREACTRCIKEVVRCPTAIFWNTSSQLRFRLCRMSKAPTVSELVGNSNITFKPAVGTHSEDAVDASVFEGVVHTSVNIFCRFVPTTTQTCCGNRVACRRNSALFPSIQVTQKG